MFCQLILRPLPPPSPYLWIPVSPTPTLRLPKVPRCEYGRLKNLILISVLFEAIFSSGICEDCEHWGGIFICKSKEIEASPYGAEVRQKWISSVSVHWIQRINSPSCSVSFCLKVCWPFRFAIVDVDDDYVTYDYYDEDEWWCAMTTSMGSNVDHVWTLFCAPLNRLTQCTWMINTSRDSRYIWQFLRISSCEENKHSHCQ